MVANKDPQFSVKAMPNEITEGGIVTLEVTGGEAKQDYGYQWVDPPEHGELDKYDQQKVQWDTTGLKPGYYPTPAVSVHVNNKKIEAEPASIIVKVRPLSQDDIIPVAMRRTAVGVTDDLSLWVVIKKSTEALSFENYQRCMDLVLCRAKPGSKEESKRKEAILENGRNLTKERFLPFTDMDAYRLLKVATEAFMMVNCGVRLKEFEFELDDSDYISRRIGVNLTQQQIGKLWGKYLQKVNGDVDQTIPYLKMVKDNLKGEVLKARIFAAMEDDKDEPEGCHGILMNKLSNPCMLELIWSYFHEEGMLVQTMNAICRRFQNIRGPGEKEPLAMFEVDPLRPLNNLLWGWIQDEQHRLSVRRRAFEYDHHYGFRLYGKVIPKMQTADSRSKFLEAYNNLLYLCARFFREDDDTTVVADGFPVLNALKEVHFILAEGAHNQFHDLPATSRMEMLMMEWILARQEFREFLPSRVMVDYPEPWMDRVDAMKSIQGWTDVPVMHFRDLGVHGEQILLSIRFGAWSKEGEAENAANWARFWRPQIQNYMHAYRAITGVDLTAEPSDPRQIAVRNLPPSVHLSQRLVRQGGRK
jgi:hypothetical protein